MHGQEFGQEFDQPSVDKMSLKRRLLLTASVAALLLSFGPVPSAIAQKLPSGANVTYGNVGFTQPNGSTLNINQSSSQAIINWNSFSVGQGDTVNFNQPGASSSTLNRVTGSTPSSIYGTINAPGTVLLVNPNGIAIGKSGVVNTGSFLSSSLGISDDDYKAGRYTFTGNGSSARVVNNGRINVSDGGFAALLGGEVANNGVIVARLGKVALGSGEQATIDLSGDGFLSVAVPTEELGNLQDETGHALVSNKGKIIANGGSVYLSAATAANILRDAVNVPGTIQANSVSGHDGAIYIGGGPGGIVTVTGHLSANGGHRHRGGTIQIAGAVAKLKGRITANGSSGGTINVVTADELDASGSLEAEGRSGTGGEIDLTAADVTLTGATVNASGTTGGGDINIGGGPHATVSLADAESVSIDEASLITANATDNGNGGHIVVWSDGLTKAYGTLSAQGGPNGGNGGLVETSGGVLDVNDINVDTLASEGTTGTWLLDPYAVTIANSCTSSCGSISSGSFTAGSNSTITATTIDNALANNNVVISTGGGSGSAASTPGSITLSSGVTLSWTSSKTLTLDATSATSGSKAAGTIALNGNISAASGGLTLEAGTSTKPGGITDTGSVNVGTFTLQAGNWSQSYSSLSVANSAANAFTATNFVLGSGTTFLRTAGGSGSSGSPYQIFDVYGLQGIGSPSGALLGDNFALAQNINASGTSGWNSGAGFVPIGESNYFSGSLNGQGYTISNLYINAPTSDANAGLFGYLSGTVSNLNLTNATVNSSYPTVTGVLAGQNYGTISNVSVAGIVTSSGNNVGGLAGESYSGASISNSTSSVTVTDTGGYYSGGLLGYNGGSVTNSSASGTVNGYTYVGGLIGDNDGTLSGDFATGNVNGGSGAGIEAVGGLIGYNSSTGSVTGSYATGNVSADTSSADNGYYTGGLIGQDAGTVFQSYATGNVTGSSAVGGLIGYADGDNIQQSFATGAVEGNYYVGGLVGILGANGTTTTLTNAYAQGAVTLINSSGADAGGLVGEMASAGHTTSITNAYAVGVVTANGGANAGAFIGYVTGNKNSITDSYFDTTTDPKLSAIGSGSISGIQGESTSVLQNMAVGSTGYGWQSCNCWTIQPGVTFPYFSWYTPPVQATISGTVYTTVGSAVGSGISVYDLINGVTENVETNAEGQYTFVLTSPLAANSNVIVYTTGTSGVSYDQNVSGSVSDLNIYYGYLSETTSVGTASSLASGLSAAINNNSTVQSEVNGLKNLAIAANGKSFAIDQALTVGGSNPTTLVLNSNGAVTQSAAITATSLDLIGGGNYTLTNSANSIGTLAASAGAVNVGDSGSLTIGAVDGTTGVTSSGAITLTAAGNLTISSGDAVTSNGSGDNIVLAATGNFTNDDGSSAVSTTGTGVWQIYSNTPSGDTFDGLNSNNTAVWDTTYPTAVTATGDRYVFAYQPTLTVTTGNLQKTYGTDDTSAVASDYTISGYQPGVAGAFLGDTSSVYTGTATLTSMGSAATADVNGGTPYGITISQGTLQALDGYALAFVSNGTLTVNKASLVLTIGNDAQTYGSPANLAADLGTTIKTGVSGQTLDIAYNSPGDTATANVGGYAINGVASNGSGLLSNYNVTLNPGTLTVNTKALTITANNEGITYGSGNNLTEGFTSNGLVNNETIGSVTLSTDATTSTSGNWNAGSWAITPSGATGGTFNPSNYSITYDAGTLTVNTKALTVTASNESITYGDGNNLTAGYSANGLVSGDTIGSVTLSTNATPSSTSGFWNAGDWTIKASATGGDSGNYKITYKTGTLDIDPAALIISATSGSKIYDGTASSGLAPTVTGLVAGDWVRDLSQSYNSADVLKANTLSVNSGYSVRDGNNGRNYVVTVETASGSITPASITLTGFKTYDSSTTFTADDFGIDGTIATGIGLQTLTLAGAGSVSSPNVIAGKQALNGGTLTLANGSGPFGGLASNYTFSVKGSTGTIIPATISLAGTKVYDGNSGFTSADFGTGGTISTGINGETLEVTGSGSVWSSNVSAGTQFLFTSGLGLANGSGLASNYRISTFGSTGVITPATLTYVASDSGMTYGGTVPGLTGTVTGFVDGQNLADATKGKLTFTTSASSTSNVGTYAIIGSGLRADHGNYVFQQASVNSTAFTITPAMLTYVATANGMIYGASVPGLTGTVTGFVNGQNLADATTGTLTFTTTATSTSNVGSYAINGSGLTADNGNYVFQQAPGNATAFTVTPAALLVTANDASETYNGLVYTGGNGVTYSGFVNGQNASVLGGSINYGGTSQGAVNAGSYTITASGLTSQNYTITYDPGMLTINRAALTVTADNASETYNGQAYAGGNGVTYSGFVNGETTSVLGGSINYGGTSQGAVNAGGYTITASGLTSQNYAITYDPGTLTINRAALTVTADDETKSFGQTEGFTGTEFTSNGLQNGETIGSVTLSSLGADSTALAGTYAISVANATGGTFDANNYAITYQPGTLTVQSAPGGYSTSQYVTPQANTPPAAVAINFQPTSASLPLIGVTHNVSTIANNTTGNNTLASNGHRRGAQDASQNIEPAGGRNSLLWPVSQFDKTQYTPGALPPYAAQASQATVLTVIARAEADNRLAPKIDLFWHDNHSDWSALHATTVKFVKFTDGKAVTRLPNGDNGFAFANGKTDIVALLKHGPVMLGAAGTFVVPETPASIVPKASPNAAPVTSAKVVPNTPAPVAPSMSAPVAPSTSTKVVPSTSTKVVTGAPANATANVSTNAATTTKPAPQTPPAGAAQTKTDSKPAVVNVVSREWLLALEVRGDGKSILAVDPITGAQVILAFDPVHHTIGAVTGIVDPKTRKLLPLGAQPPAFDANLNIPPAAWTAVKSFTPASYFAVSM